MIKKKYNFIKLYQAVGLLLLIGIGASSCKVTHPYLEPEAPPTDLYRDIQVTDTHSMANVPWQELFSDPILQNLIQEGIDHNPDLQIAFSRINVARANYAQSRVALLPDLNLAANAEHSTNNNFQLGLSSGWEIDIWGKLGSSKRAELANLLQNEAAANAVKTGLVATIATYYYQLLSLDKQLLITEETLQNWKSTVITMQALKEAGRVTEAAVVQSEAQQYGVEVSIPDLKQSIKEFENSLSVLIGIPPTAIERGKIENQKLTPQLATGLPAQLLANRPDVLEAELNLRKHYELTNVARAYFYPTISISASAGQYSSSIDNLFDPGSTLARIGGGLLQPIFGKRMNKTRLEIAKEQAEQARLNFQSTLLNAGLEVSNALSLYNTTLAKASIRENQIQALIKSVNYSQELLENGFANYTEVITARQSLLQAELAGESNRLARLRAIINLYSSLGGGWKL